MKKKDLVVKDNALINASYTLDLVEMRLITLAIIEARETGRGVGGESYLQIHADHYAKLFNVTRQTAYKVLKTACNSLFERQVTYYDVHPESGKPRKNKTRWVQKVGYIENTAIVQIAFASDVVPLITRLEANFTEYEQQQIAGLHSVYAFRLYEIIIKWRTTGKTPPMKLDDLRNQLGLIETDYPRIFDLKKRVIDLAVDQINKNTDITVSYEQKKDGRAITDIIFSFKQKAGLSEATKDLKKTIKKRSVSAFAGIEIQMYKELKKDFDFITESYIRDLMVKYQQDAATVMTRVRRESDPSQFNLEKTD